LSMQNSSNMSEPAKPVQTVAVTERKKLQIRLWQSQHPGMRVYPKVFGLSHNKIYTYNNKHLLRSNTNGYGGKTHYADSQNSDTTAPSGRELYHLQSRSWQPVRKLLDTLVWSAENPHIVHEQPLHS
jgi:hypothetical protein